MRRLILVLFGVMVTIGTVSGQVSAQQGGIDPAFSDSIIRTYGYPEIAIEVSPEGVQAPSTLEAGYYLVTLSATGENNVGYVDIMQPPVGLSDEEATELALAAARDDLAQEGWVYAGGTNTPGPGETASFVIYLAEGEYKIAASIYADEEGSDETMRLLPLSVIAPAPASPVASPVASGEPAATVTLEMTDELGYTVGPDTVPAGPQVWKIANSGEHHAHHMVMFRIPDGVSADDIVSDFTAMFSGTPPAGEPLMAQMTWVGYAALQSGGQTTWAEFDLKAGTYAVICFIIDPATARPHVLDGMVSVFTVA